MSRPCGPIFRSWPRGCTTIVPLVYLDNAATRQAPRQVIQSIVNTYERQYANVHRGIHWLSEQSTDLYEEARQRVQAFINAPAPEQVIFTHGTTESINLVARSWGDANLTAGDEMLLTEMEHHSNLVPWHQLAARRGVVVRHVPITDDGLLDLDEFRRMLNRADAPRRRDGRVQRAGNDQPDRGNRARGACRRRRSCWSTPPRACRT